MKILLKTTVLFLLFTASASHAQMCTSLTGQTTPVSRFTLQEDLVTDKKTGLIWQRCMAGQSWNSATQSCDGIGLKLNWKDALERVPEGWRLANISELFSIMEYSCVRPAVNLTVFPNASDEMLWTSTPLTTSAKLAWVMQSSNGQSANLRKDVFQLNYRLVKGISGE